jgi:hypothetical protein
MAVLQQSNGHSCAASFQLKLLEMNHHSPLFPRFPIVCVVDLW